MTITQSLVDAYERMATHNDPHSPWYDGASDEDDCGDIEERDEYLTEEEDEDAE